VDQNVCNKYRSLSRHQGNIESSIKAILCLGEMQGRDADERRKGKMPTSRSGPRKCAKELMQAFAASSLVVRVSVLAARSPFG
jgi:hypothetical protein